jgi:4-hydroxybenzoate polyprenyltransferase
LKDKIFAYLQLTRFPNLFTSVADVLAGYLIIRGLRLDWLELLALCLSTCFIYGGGCILNDVCDRNRDARERPFRPIPSGRVSPREALFLTFIFFGLGLTTAFLAGKTPFVIASILILLVISYDIFTKEMPVAGPITMAACRGVNLLLGMSPSLFLSGITFLFPLISVIYVFALTTLSQFEVEGGLGGRGWIVSGYLILVIFIISVLRMTKYLAADCLIYMGLLILFAGLPLLAGLLRPAPDRVGRAVKFLILGIPLLDAVYVSGLHGWAYGIPVALCTVPSMVLSRYVYVT